MKMVNFSKFKLLLLCLMCLVIILPNVEAKKDRVRLQDVQTLTLHSDRWTTSRRGSPIKQLNCVGGYCNQAPVQTAQCYNRGSDGRDVQWECKADLPAGFKLGRLDVSCEGYDYPDDDYILAGSCGLQYTIVGAPGAQHSNNQHHDSDFDHELFDKIHEKHGKWIPWTPVITTLIIIGIIYYACLREENSSSRSTSGTDYPSGGGGGGGTGGGGWFSSGSSSPPPPGFRSDYYGGGGDSCGSTYSTRSGSGSSYTGFWSGLAAGGLMGYLFGNSPSNTFGGSRYGRSSYTSDWSGGRPSTSSGFFGSSGFESGGSSSRSRSSGTTTSTGFASTSRR